QGAPCRFHGQLPARRHGAGRAARADARGDRAVVEPRLDGPADAARHRRRGAQPADADQGVRQVRAPEETDFTSDHGGVMRTLLWLLLLLPALAFAQYPNRPVRMIIPFAPGGA